MLAQKSDEDSTKSSGVLKSIFGIGQPTIGGLIQLWDEYQAKANPGGSRQYYNSFLIQRIEIKFSGRVNDKIAYGVMVDFARSISNSSREGRVSVLQDAHIDLSYLPEARLTVGQFKYPLTHEGLVSSGKLDFVERSEITRIFGDKRDIGIQIGGEFQHLDYAVSLVNGNSQNEIDQNSDKDVVGRIVLKPVKGISFGGSGYLGRTGANGETPYDRAAAEFMYEGSGLKFASEFLWAREGKFGPLSDMKGFYATSLYQIEPPTQVGVRYEYADRNLEIVKGVPRHRFTLGVNRFLDEKNGAKVQLNVLFTEDRVNNWNHYVYVNLQVSI